MNERETFLRYPRKSFEWWLRHDHWTVTTMHSRPKPMIQWENCEFREKEGVAYGQIPTLDFMEYRWLADRRQLTADDALAVKKYKFLETFNVEDSSEVRTELCWKLYCEHPGWVANTIVERFGDLEDEIRRRFGELWQSQKNSEWMDMSAARLVLITKIVKKLGITQLWNADKVLISPGAFQKAARFVQKNKHQALLAFGIWKPTVKKLLLSWGGHALKIHTRIRTRERQDVPIPEPNCSVAEFTRYMEGRSLLVQFKQMHGPRLLKKDIRPYLRQLRRVWKSENASVRVDESIRTLESPPWDLLRHPGRIS
jgi:hypothetical protein